MIFVNHFLTPAGLIFCFELVMGPFLGGYWLEQDDRLVIELSYVWTVFVIAVVLGLVAGISTLF